MNSQTLKTYHTSPDGKKWYDVFSPDLDIAKEWAYNRGHTFIGQDFSYGIGIVCEFKAKTQLWVDCNPTIYKIWDSNTKEYLPKHYTHDKRNLAHNKADKLDMQYGAVRYIVQPIFN